MRLKLFHKLFLVLAGTSLCSVLLFAGFAHWSSTRNFLRYLNDDRETRLAALSEQLLAVYERDGDWQVLQDDQRAWHRVLRDAMRAGGAGDLPLPPHDGSTQPRHPPPPLLRGRSRIEPTLYDLGHRIIAGPLPYRSDMTLRPLVRDGRTLAYLGMPPLRKPAEARDVRFARRQGHMLLGGAAFALILSLLAAAWVARRQSRPIVELGAAARALASGQFGTRLEAQSHDEIGELVGDFNLLARTLQDNESARRRWFADVSHELRTPLAIMRGELEAASDGIRAIDGALIESLSQESARLTHLVEDLYQLARADIGALDYEFTRASLGALLTESISHFAHRWQQAGLEYDYQIDADLCAQLDTRRILQLLENLFENCCRYTDAPGRITVSARRVGGTAQLIVADSGPAVPAEDLALLFEPLHRVERSRSRAHGGSGLGLAICKRIVLAHGGHIEAQASPLGGLAIHIQLDLVP
jgi:two-component system sensor histidine kinase BaeS